MDAVCLVSPCIYVGCVCWGLIILSLSISTAQSRGGKHFSDKNVMFDCLFLNLYDLCLLFFFLFFLKLVDFFAFVWAHVCTLMEKRNLLTLFLPGKKTGSWRYLTALTENESRRRRLTNEQLVNRFRESNNWLLLRLLLLLPSFESGFSF